MNIVTSAITDIIGYRIPIELLEIAFLRTDSVYSGAPITIEERILNKVVKPRVLRDTNIAGGQIIKVDTAGLQTELTDYRTLVIQVSPERVNFRMILSALSASYLPQNSANHNMFPMMAYSATGTGSDLLSAAHRVGSSHANVPIISTAHVELIGESTVLIREQTRIAGIYSLNLLVGNQENLNNMSIKTFPAFSKLCELGIKSYIHNHLKVKIDQQYLINGQPLGSIKEMVDEYRDAEEMYQTFLAENWAAIATLSDPVRRRRLIKFQLPVGL